MNGESGEDRSSPVDLNGLGLDMTMDRSRVAARLSEREMQAWLSGGLNRPDRRLALFDQFGERIDPNIVRAAIAAGLAEPWFASPMRPQWTVCRLTSQGYDVLVRRAATK